MAKRKTSRKRETISFDVMPPPKGKLTKAKALSWIENELPGYLMVAQDGFGRNERHPKLSSGWPHWNLLNDVSEMTKACAEVIRGRPAPRFERGDCGSSQLGTQELAELVAQRSDEMNPVEGSPWRQAYIALEQELLVRMKLHEREWEKTFSAKRERTAELEAELERRPERRGVVEEAA